MSDSIQVNPKPQFNRSMMARDGNMSRTVGSFFGKEANGMKESENVNRNGTTAASVSRPSITIHGQGEIIDFKASNKAMINYSGMHSPIQETDQSTHLPILSNFKSPQANSLMQQPQTSPRVSSRSNLQRRNMMLNYMKQVGVSPVALKVAPQRRSQVRQLFQF
jgi:hypothetical protein